MPKSLLEGLASGCLCIVSPHYGCTEIVKDRINGVVCHGYQADDICEAIERAKHAPSAELPLRAQRDISLHYSLARVTEIHRKAYSAARVLIEHSPEGPQ